jgi:hypothetical protein
VLLVDSSVSHKPVAHRNKATAAAGCPLPWRSCVTASRLVPPLLVAARRLAGECQPLGCVRGLSDCSVGRSCASAVAPVRAGTAKDPVVVKKRKSEGLVA